MDIHFARYSVVASMFCMAAQAVLAAIPEQFQIWGTAAPELKAVPDGWNEVRQEPEVAPVVNPTAEELARGFLLMARDPLQFELPWVRCPSALSCFATPGEYEPIMAGVYALRDVSDLEVRLSELRSKRGDVITSDCLDVRVVRAVPVILDAANKQYRRQPFLLERRNSFAVKKGECGWVWLTLKVPAEARSGDYTGKLRFARAGTALAQLDVSVRVLPFSLPALPYESTLYYPRPAESDDMLLKELVDFREHGASIPIPAMEVCIRSRDRKFGRDDVEETKQYSNRLLGKTRKVYGEWRFPVTFEVGHQIAYYWDQPKGWFSYWPHSAEIEADLGAAIGLIREISAANGVSSLRAYLSDEGGAHNLLDETIYYNSWTKEHFPDIAPTATIGGGIALGFDEIGQLGGAVDFLSANRFTPEIARALGARSKPFGVYNGAGATPAGARFFFGFYGFKTGARQIGQWSYSFGESIFSGNGLRLEDEGYVYHAPDGLLPSTFWEAVREGIDDARYLELLWQYVRGAEPSSRAEERGAAAHARELMQNILGKIDWGFQAMQSGDRTPPPPPSTLRKWRWRIAQEILSLGKQEKLVAGLQLTNRPSALDWPWAPVPKEDITFGPELLPPSDFETGFAPWRIEAWKGNGTGQLDANEHPGGKQSVRITVPADAGNSAVTVLVWPQYGDGKLNIALDGGRTYELSAWSKWQDRSTQPELRINVPSENVETTRTGHEPRDPSGWQRLWSQVTLKAPAKPTYLAAWAQGPGTVWLDDLSLREVIAPPFTASLDQDEYDALDQTGTATVTLSRQPQPTALRCTLASSSGKAVAELTIASAAFRQAVSKNEVLSYIPAGERSCRIIFCPAALKPGDYELRVELLGADNSLLTTKALAFTRSAGTQ